MDRFISLYVELPEDLAWALAQLLKRLGYGDCRALADSDAQAHQMIDATERVRQVLAKAGCAPR
jgi:hypothetical protein